MVSSVIKHIRENVVYYSALTTLLGIFTACWYIQYRRLHHFERHWILAPFVILFIILFPAIHGWGELFTIGYNEPMRGTYPPVKVGVYVEPGWHPALINIINLTRLVLCILFRWDYPVVTPHIWWLYSHIDYWLVILLAVAIPWFFWDVAKYSDWNTAGYDLQADVVYWASLPTAFAAARAITSYWKFYFFEPYKDGVWGTVFDRGLSWCLHKGLTIENTSESWKKYCGDVLSTVYTTPELKVQLREQLAPRGRIHDSWFSEFISHGQVHADSELRRWIAYYIHMQTTPPPIPPEPPEAVVPAGHKLFSFFWESTVNNPIVYENPEIVSGAIAGAATYGALTFFVDLSSIPQWCLQNPGLVSGIVGVTVSALLLCARGTKAPKVPHSSKPPNYLINNDKLVTSPEAAIPSVDASPPADIIASQVLDVPSQLVSTAPELFEFMLQAGAMFWGW